MAPAASDTYEHQPLNHNEPSIRLLHINPELSPEGLIRCTISHATTKARYTCLSYRWGDEPPIHRILINSRPFFIRPNLFDFLTIARTKRTASESLWIDALCIDQDNVRERNHQVQQMGQIFSQAEGVLLWLGNLEYLIPIIRNLDREYFKASHNERSVVRSQKKLVIENLHYNKYWTRAWVTQEIVLARKVTILIASEEMPLADLFLTLNVSYILPLLGTPLGQFANEGKEFVGAKLIQLLAHFRDKKCGVPRDRIFSLLALCSEGGDIEVDYGIPDEDLAYNVMSLCHSSVCICSTIVVAQSLGLSGEPHGGYPYLEFDVSALAFGIRPWSTLSCFQNVDTRPLMRYSNGRIDYLPATEDNFGIAFDLYPTCTAVTQITQLIWKEPSPKGAGEERTVWTRRVSGWPELIHLGTYRRGFEFFRKGAECDIYVVRIAFSVLAKFAIGGTGTCAAVRKQRPKSVLGRPRIGYAEYKEDE